jgi:3-hydroxyacyl-[acyl-carrier-protein] dehydratase
MTPIDIRGILEYLPHRYPFLLIDRVLELEPGKRIVAIKNVTINEPYFVGHFPHIPVMPGVLMIEALAQAAGVLSFETLGRRSDASSVFYFVGIDGARFKKPVMPGDQLILKVELLRNMRGIWKYATRAEVDGELVAEAVAACSRRGVPGIRNPAVNPEWRSYRRVSRILDLDWAA